jgi:hypothetical protein
MSNALSFVRTIRTYTNYAKKYNLRYSTNNKGQYRASIALRVPLPLGVPMTRISFVPNPDIELHFLFKGIRTNIMRFNN